MTSLRDVSNTSQIRCLFCGVFKTSHKNLKKDAFFVTFLRHLKNISKKCLFCGVLKMSQKHLKKGVFFVTSLRSIKQISKKIVSKLSQNNLALVFVTFQKYPMKMVVCNLRRVIEISDKTDVGPLETLKKYKNLSRLIFETQIHIQIQIRYSSHCP